MFPSVVILIGVWAWLKQTVREYSVLPEGLSSSSAHIRNHRAFYTMCIVRQEYSKGPDNMDLPYPSLSPTAVPMILYQNSVCASLNPVRLSLILAISNPGIAESLLTVSMFTVKRHLDLAIILATHTARVAC